MFKFAFSVFYLNVITKVPLRVKKSIAYVKELYGMILFFC